MSHENSFSILVIDPSMMLRRALSRNIESRLRKNPQLCTRNIVIHSADPRSTTAENAPDLIVQGLEYGATGLEIAQLMSRKIPLILYALWSQFTEETEDITKQVILLNNLEDLDVLFDKIAANIQKR